MMQAAPQRSHRLYIRVISAVGFILLLGLGAVAQQDWFPYPFVVPRFMDTLHYPAGIVIAVVILWIWPGSKRLGVVGAVAGSLVVFGGIEIIQPYFYRERSLGDLGNSLLGSGIGIAAYLLYDSPWHTARRLLYVAGVIMMGAMAMPSVFALRELTYLIKVWPLIGDFETTDSALAWKPSRDAVLARLPHGVRYLKHHPGNTHYAVLQPDGTAWPSMAYRPIEVDWRGYNALCLDAKTDQPGKDLILRVDDRRGAEYLDSVSQRIPLNQYWQTLCLELKDLRTPRGLPINLGTVMQLVLSLDGRQKASFLAVDNVHLMIRE